MMKKPMLVTAVSTVLCRGTMHLCGRGKRTHGQCGSPTRHVGGVKGVKGKGEDVLRVALLPQLGARVSVPQDDVVGGVNG